MNTKTIFVAIAFAMLCWNSFAQTAHQHAASSDTNTFTVEWVVSEVLKSNPSLAAARANAHAAEERIVQAKSWENPRATFDTVAGRFVSVPENSFTDQSLGIEQPLPISRKNRLRGDVAKADAAISTEELRRRELDLVARARASYLRLANAYEMLKLNRESAGFLKQIAESARYKYEAGTETQANLLNAETELAKLEESAFDFQRQIADEESVLNTLMNRPQHAPFGKPQLPTMEIFSGDFDQLSKVAFANRPEVRGAANRVAAAKTNLRLAQRAKIPDPSVRAQLNRYNEASQPISEVMVGFSIDLPWFNQKKLSAAVREQRDLLEAAENNLIASKTETAGMLRAQLNKLHTLHHHYELFSAKVLPLSRQTIEATRLSYQTGKTSFTDVMLARHSAQDSEAMIIQHQIDYQIALAELEALIGAPLPKEK
jgi:outer membrane protein, heavy metal efflux system